MLTAKGHSLLPSRRTCLPSMGGDASREGHCQPGCLGEAPEGGAWAEAGAWEGRKADGEGGDEEGCAAEGRAGSRTEGGGAWEAEEPPVSPAGVSRV